MYTRHFDAGARFSEANRGLELSEHAFSGGVNAWEITLHGTECLTIIWEGSR